jgi:DNA mismatch endonuclease (patch repair protein)
MGRVRSKDTGPELVVRRLVHAMGYRYRLHGKGLPGRPDLVFRSRGKLIFVHGCFWHLHKGCALARLPKSRTDFWLPKLEANRLRDAKTQRALRRAGWKVLVVWECQLKSEARTRDTLRRFLDA